MACLKRSDEGVVEAGKPTEEHAALCRLVRWSPMSAAEFAPELPPNSPQRRENPVSSTGSDRRFLAFLGGEGGIRTPGTSKRHNGFRDRRIQPLCHLSAQTSWRLWPRVQRQHQSARWIVAD